MSLLSQLDEILSNIEFRVSTNIVSIIIHLTGVIRLCIYLLQNNISNKGPFSWAFRQFGLIIIGCLLTMIMDNHLFPKLNDELAIIEDYCHVLGISFAFGNVICKFTALTWEVFTATPK